MWKDFSLAEIFCSQCDLKNKTIFGSVLYCDRQIDGKFYILCLIY